jgi:pimeloyl-ACP methyl ester carboxylesterase
LVVGREDTITPPAQSLALAEKIPGAWLVRFSDAGHWLMYQMPGDLARVVEAFLDRQDALTH